MIRRLGSVLVVSSLACAVAPPAPAEDPVVAQARAVLVEKHPSGDRVARAAVPAGGSRAERIISLLAALGDPSTRLLGPEAWRAFLADDLAPRPPVDVEADRIEPFA